MKILIANAYQQGKSSPQFQQFEKQVKQIIKNLKQLIDISCDVFTCDSTNIDQYLFEPRIPKKEAAQQFNFLDMVFIEGDANLRPWSPKAKKFLLLIKMCIKSNKILWASSFGMQALVYLSASNIEKPLHIVNGLNGGNIKDIKKSVLNLEELKHFDLFLDNISGDLYEYDQSSKQWRPYANVGMHSRKQAQENPFPGRIIMKAEVHRINSKHEDLVQLYEGQTNETICYLKKVYINHYSLTDVDHELLIPCKNQWDLHEINFPNPDLKFNIIADSKYTSQIIELNDNIFSTQFNIHQKYPETVKILKNFIKHQMSRFQNGVMSEPIEHAAFKLLDGSIGGDQPANLLEPQQVVTQPNVNCFHESFIKQKNPCEQLIKNNQQQLYQQYQNNLVQQNNNNTNNNITNNYQNNNNQSLNQKSQRIQSANKKVINFTLNNNNNSQYNINFEENQLASIGTRGKGQRPITAMTRPGTAQTMKSFSDYKGSGQNFNKNNNRLFSGKSNVSFGNQFIQNNNFVGDNNINENDFQSQQKQDTIINNNIKNRTFQTSRNENSFNNNSSNVNKTGIAFGGNYTQKITNPLIKNEFDDQVGDQRVLKTKAEIRQLLHPQISQNAIPQKETIWIPGHQSCKNLGLSGVWKDQQQSKRSKIVQIKNPKNKYFQSSRGKDLQEQEKLFKTLANKNSMNKSNLRFVPDYEEAREIPVVRCSSAYLSKFDREMIDEKFSRQKELGDHQMRMGKPKQQAYAGSVITQGKYAHNFLNHQYRDEKRKSWVDPDQNFRSAV